MEMEVIILGVSHYDMTSDNGGKGASVKVYGNLKHDNNYAGVTISESDIPYEELSVVVGNKLPGKFKANIEMGSVKKRGSNKEVTSLVFSNLRYLHAVELLPVKGA